MKRTVRLTIYQNNRSKYSKLAHVLGGLVTLSLIIDLLTLTDKLPALDLFNLFFSPLVIFSWLIITVLDIRGRKNAAIAKESGK